MAESKMVNMVADILTCSICTELIDDPRMLLCQHTFCCNCLVKYLETKAIKDKLECPICRQWCSIPNGNVDELPVSLTFNQLKDAKQVTLIDQHTTLGEVLFPRYFCLQCPHEVALAFCVICEYICDGCMERHQCEALLKEHVILPLEEVIKDKKEDSLTTCPEHPYQLLIMHCKDCNSPLCYLCYSSSHSKQICDSVIDQSSRALYILTQTVDKVDSFLDKSEKLSQIIKGHSVKLENSIADIRRNITMTVDDIHRNVDAIKEKTTEDMYTHYLRIKMTTDAEATRIDKVRETLRSVKVSYATILQLGKPYDIIQHATLIQRQLHENNPDNITLTLYHLDVEDARKKLDNIHVSSVLKYSLKTHESNKKIIDIVI